MKIDSIKIANGTRRAIPDSTSTTRVDLVNVTPLDVKAKVIHPYMHIFGFTGNYFEGDFTQAVLRFEIGVRHGGALPE